MKYARPLIGLVIVFLALWVIIGEQMSGASANAVVNAPVVTVRSDVAGTLDLPDRDFGSRVSAGEIVAAITDGLVDTIRLNDLLMEIDFARAETARITGDLEASRTLRETLVEDADIFHEERLAEIRTRLDHARLRLAILEGGDASDNFSNFLNLKFKLEEEKSNTQGNTLKLNHDYS